MATKTLAVAALAATLFTSTILPAAAEESGRWHTFQKWDIRVDQNLGYGCYMHANYVGGTGLRVGINAARDTGYVEIMNPAWDSLTVGAEITVTLSFDDGAAKPWSGSVRTLADGTRMIYFGTDNIKFWPGLAAASVIEIRYRGAMLLRGNLAGSAEAVASVLDCQQAFTGKPSDPFRATAPVRRLDPFRTL